MTKTATQKLRRKQAREAALNGTQGLRPTDCRPTFEREAVLKRMKDYAAVEMDESYKKVLLDLIKNFEAEPVKADEKPFTVYVPPHKKKHQKNTYKLMQKGKKPTYKKW